VGAIETLPVERWDGPFEAGLQGSAVATLEAGRVLLLPRLAFVLDEAERRLLTAASGDGRHKNISFDAKTGTCKGGALTDEATEQLATVMRRFADQAAALLAGLAPGYAPGLERARTSFRPTEIAGRELPWRKDDRRLHIDAFPSRPLRGRRILRVFANVDPTGAPRRWHIGEPFEQHAGRFLPRVHAPLPGSAAVLAWLGLTRGARSRYDHIMLGLHDAAKRDIKYQTAPPRAVVDFPAGSTWIAYTDEVPHAALAGHYAFEQTFHVDPAVMANPDHAPLVVLQRLTHRALV
jgi:3-deoxy-D-manno-oct-2-ulosonic acid (Kdo) hydroxylase